MFSIQELWNSCRAFSTIKRPNGQRNMHKIYILHRAFTHMKISKFSLTLLTFPGSLFLSLEFCVQFYNFFTTCISCRASNYLTFFCWATENLPASCTHFGKESATFVCKIEQNILSETCLYSNVPQTHWLMGLIGFSFGF